MRRQFGSRIVYILLVTCLAVAPAASENLNPAHWTLEAPQSAAAPGSTAVLKLRAEIEPGYHLYSLTTPKGGPIRTTIALRANAGIVNDAVYQRRPQRQLDPSLGVMVEVFAGSVDFLLPTKVKSGQAAGPRTVTAQVRYQVCSDRICLPPANREAKAEIAIRDGAPAQGFSAPAGYQKVSLQTTSVDTRAGGTLDLHFVLLALGLGFAALFTPCVFPLIPLTVSYFLDPKEGGRAQTIRQALLFGAGIVLFFASLGYAASAVAGPFGVVELASNPWVNLTIAMVFGAIAINMLGGFEIGLPSGLLTSLDGVSRRGGLVGTALLGLTFSLTSFACVGPFMGTLLAASIQTAGWTPLIGMTAFALGMATPFVLLALFPALLRRLPRGGGWLARVKVVFGFVILAVMFKYLATVDQVLQLHLLTRERFIAIWFALFLMTAFYLLGLVRLSSDDGENAVGLACVVTGVAVLAFAVSILPGLWGRQAR